MQVITGTVQTIPQQIMGNIKPTIASSGEEYQKGYEEGKKEGYDSGFENGFADGKEQGFEDGKNSVPQFDRCMKSGTFTTLNMFKEPIVVLNLDSWGETGNFTNFLNVNSAECKNTRVEHLTINASHAFPTSVQQMFFCSKQESRDYTLKKITFNINTQNSINNSYLFGGLTALEVIEGIPIDFSSITSNANQTTPFSLCSALIEFRVVANSIKYSLSIQHSPNLSTDTIQSIIDGLTDLTGQTSQTLTLHSTVANKLTEEQYIAMFNKNWDIQ